MKFLLLSILILLNVVSFSQVDRNNLSEEINRILKHSDTSNIAVKDINGHENKIPSICIDSIKNKTYSLTSISRDQAIQLLESNNTVANLIGFWYLSLNAKDENEIVKTLDQFIKHNIEVAPKRIMLSCFDLMKINELSKLCLELVNPENSLCSNCFKISQESIQMYNSLLSKKFYGLEK
ncbi:MAG: hypothetical protein R2730_09410 [Chitinophagales bacterium]|nr:hypothetical protein [Bacteroidota bacterium]